METNDELAMGGDWIHLRGVEVDCVLGVYAEERERERPVRIDVSLACEVRRAGASDDLADALNYERIEADVVAAAKASRCRLVEALAERVAAACLAYEGVRRVRVRVEKPGALAHTRSVAVEIVRGR
jgi:FolB domain-containing protein